MSRIGQKPILIPDNVEFTVDNQLVKVKGPKGALELELHPKVKVEKKESVTKISLPDAYTQEKGTKCILAPVSTEDGELLNTILQWQEGYPTRKEEIANYNITDNSINSKDIAEKLREVFDIATEEIELTCEVKEVEGTKLVVITGKVEEIEPMMEHLAVVPEIEEELVEEEVVNN